MQSSRTCATTSGEGSVRGWEEQASGVEAGRQQLPWDQWGPWLGLKERDEPMGRCVGWNPGLVSTWEKLVALIGWCAGPPAVVWGLGGWECSLIGLSS